ncbi:hypothetical protein ACJJTC_014162, partial [Scirpophaga incertulas]
PARRWGGQRVQRRAGGHTHLRAAAWRGCAPSVTSADATASPPGGGGSARAAQGGGVTLTCGPRLGGVRAERDERGRHGQPARRWGGQRVQRRAGGHTHLRAAAWRARAAQGGGSHSLAGRGLAGCAPSVTSADATASPPGGGGSARAAQGGGVTLTCGPRLGGVRAERDERGRHGQPARRWGGQRVQRRAGARPAVGGQRVQRRAGGSHSLAGRGLAGCAPSVTSADATASPPGGGGVSACSAGRGVTLTCGPRLGGVRAERDERGRHGQPARRWGVSACSAGRGGHTHLRAAAWRGCAPSVTSADATASPPGGGGSARAAQGGGVTLTCGPRLGGGGGSHSLAGRGLAGCAPSVTSADATASPPGGGGSARAAQGGGSHSLAGRGLAGCAPSVTSADATASPPGGGGVSACSAGRGVTLTCGPRLGGVRAERDERGRHGQPARRWGGQRGQRRAGGHTHLRAAAWRGARRA